MRGGAVRAMVGIMAGRDQLLSAVTVRAPNGQELGQFEINSTNSSAWGTSHGLLEDHADKIINYLKSGKE